jgi:hypothetical protein
VIKVSTDSNTDVLWTQVESRKCKGRASISKKFYLDSEYLLK